MSHNQQKFNEVFNEHDYSMHERWVALKAWELAHLTQAQAVSIARAYQSLHAIHKTLQIDVSEELQELELSFPFLKEIEQSKREQLESAMRQFGRVV